MYIFLTLGSAIACLKVDGPIVTDRPDFTESAHLVPERRLQMESGATFERARDTRAFGVPELLLRYGLSEELELRVGLPNFSAVRVEGNRDAGWGDTYLGVKAPLGKPLSAADAALIVATFIPTGDKGVGSQGAEPEVKLCVAGDLDDRLSLSGMIYGAWPSEGSPIWQGTLSFGYTLRENFTAFLEYGGSLRRGDRTEHVYHGGFAYRPRLDEQWDIHAGKHAGGRSGNFFGLGYSVRR